MFRDVLSVILFSFNVFVSGIFFKACLIWTGLQTADCKNPLSILKGFPKHKFIETHY